MNRGQRTGCQPKPKRQHRLDNKTGLEKLSELVKWRQELEEEVMWFAVEVLGLPEDPEDVVFMIKLPDSGVVAFCFRIRSFLVFAWP